MITLTNIKNHQTLKLVIRNTYLTNHLNIKAFLDEAFAILSINRLFKSICCTTQNSKCKLFKVFTVFSCYL